MVLSLKHFLATENPPPPNLNYIENKNNQIKHNINHQILTKNLKFLIN